MRPKMLGKRVRDTLTGFEGFVQSYTCRLHGGDIVEICPSHLSEEGYPLDGCVFHVARIEMIEPQGGQEDGE